MSTTLLNAIIAALIALGLLSSPTEWNTKTQQEKDTLTEIVINDLDQ
ncbi:MAG: hypothetical protein IPN76_27990 [Saprospiraceae bacterium]|jgi:hypothetical protein|nr:hypothetical protein [Saprospiraceae bacterium]